MTKKFKGEEFRNTTVCIDAYDSKTPIGRIYNSSLPDGKCFHGMTQFLLEMERVLDETELPKAFTELRVFAPPESEESEPAQIEYRDGDEATFIVRILFRQNASWQGSLTWLEGKQEQCFRSVLELILLLDSALSYKKAS